MLLPDWAGAKLEIKVPGRPSPVTMSFFVVTQNSHNESLLEMYHAYWYLNKEIQVEIYGSGLQSFKIPLNRIAVFENENER